MQEWQTKAVVLYNKYGNAWTRIASELSEELGETFTTDRVRHYLRYGQFENKPENPTKKQEPQDLLKILQKEHSLDELADKSGMSQRMVLAKIEDLRDAGYLITDISGKYSLSKISIPQANEHTLDWNGDKIIRFGVTSDNHLCNKMSQVSFLHHLYDVFEREGISDVYNGGDAFDGYYKNRAEHIYELIPGCIGADEQVEYAAKNYPRRKGITTHIIGGNHCATHIKNGGHDVVKALCNRREDMNYLGFFNAVVNLTPNCKMEINHPLDGSAFSLSYSPQRYIDSMSGGDKPSILLNAHHHKLFYMMYRNVHAFETGCTEAQTGFMKGKRIAAHVGGIIIEVHVDKQGTINRCKSEFIPCYTMLKEDWGIR